jgi:serine/threonine-protein kinase RIO1
MAAFMFCIGHRRIVYENSSLMFHNFSGGVTGKSQEMKDYLKHTIKNVTSFFKGHVLGLSDKEIKAMIKGQEFWFCTKEMCERGIATHVNIEGVIVPAKQYLNILKKAKRKAKKKGLKISSIAQASLNGINVMDPIISDQNQSFEEISEHISSAVQSNEFLYN